MCSLHPFFCQVYVLPSSNFVEKVEGSIDRFDPPLFIDPLSVVSIWPFVQKLLMRGGKIRPRSEGVRSRDGRRSHNNQGGVILRHMALFPIAFSRTEYNCCVSVFVKYQVLNKYK